MNRLRNVITCEDPMRENYRNPKPSAISIVNSLAVIDESRSEQFQEVCLG